MKDIKNLDKINKNFNGWQPSDLAFIRKIEWTANNMIIVFLSQLRKDVIEWPDLSKDFFEISLLFENIANLKLDFSGFGIHQISGFDIIDISKNSWENLNFQIEDYENGTISFNCKEINVLVVSAPVKVLFE